MKCTPRIRRSSPMIVVTDDTIWSGSVGKRVGVTTSSSSRVVSRGSWARAEVHTLTSAATIMTPRAIMDNSPFHQLVAGRPAGTHQTIPVRRQATRKLGKAFLGSALLMAHLPPPLLPGSAGRYGRQIVPRGSGGV